MGLTSGAEVVRNRIRAYPRIEGFDCRRHDVEGLEVVDARGVLREYTVLKSFKVQL